MRFHLAVALATMLAGCGGSPGSGFGTDLPDDPLGDQCEGGKAASEPDLMGWNVGQRALLGSMRRHGVVAVHYEASGCDVELEVLPNQSPWGKVFTVWRKAVKKKTKGQLELQFFWNGQQGDERAMIGKIKAGQLDAAAVSAVGMSKVYKPILALQTPGLFRDWASLDRAREALRPELEKGIRDAGFEVFGWGDIGKLRGMSKGFAVRVPSDLKGKLPLSWRDDSIGPMVYQTLGVTPVPLSVPEVLPALNTGKINVLSAPALAAEQLQWASRLDHVSSEASVMAIGSMVWSKSRVDALPGEATRAAADDRRSRRASTRALHLLGLPPVARAGPGAGAS